MSRFSLVLVALALGAGTALVPGLMLLGAPAWAQGTASKSYSGIPPTTHIWVGIYTDEQADQGALIYRSGCSVCHGKQLEGVPDEGNPALASPGFMVEWDNETMADLVRHIHIAPNDRPGDMDPLTAVALAAFILNQNGVPSGKTPLSTDRTEESKILITAHPPTP